MDKDKIITEQADRIVELEKRAEIDKKLENYFCDVWDGLSIKVKEAKDNTEVALACRDFLTKASDIAKISQKRFSDLEAKIATMRNILDELEKEIHGFSS